MLYSPYINVVWPEYRQLFGRPEKFSGGSGDGTSKTACHAITVVIFETKRHRPVLRPNSILSYPSTIFNKVPI